MPSKGNMYPDSMIWGRKLVNVIWKAWNWFSATVEISSPSVSDATTKAPAAT